MEAYNFLSMDRPQVFYIATLSAKHRPIFLWDPNPGTLLEILLGFREQGKYLLHEFAILPDQLQALITPLGDTTAAAALEMLQAEFSARAAKKLKTSIWDESFVIQPIRDSSEYQKFRRSIHLAPVRAGLVAKPTLYPFSSAFPDLPVDCSPQALTAIGPG